MATHRRSLIAAVLLVAVLVVVLARPSGDPAPGPDVGGVPVGAADHAPGPVPAVADPSGRDAQQTALSDPVDAVVGVDGLVHVLLAGTAQVVRVEADGVLSLVAGRGGAGKGGSSGGDGVTGAAACHRADRGAAAPAVGALLCGPTQLAVDADGTLLIADGGHGLIRRVDGDGVIEDVTGAGLDAPYAELAGIAVDAGELLSTDAATGTVLSGTAPPTPISTDLEQPRGVAVDRRGVVHVADAAGRVVRIVDGRAETAVGRAGPGETAAVDDATAPLGSPWDVAVDADGRLWIADLGTATVRWRDLAGPLETVPFAFGEPVGLGAHPDGGVVVADRGRDAVWRVTPDGTVTRLAGVG